MAGFGDLASLSEPLAMTALPTPLLTLPGAPPAAIALPPPALPTFNLVTMLVVGLLLQALSSSPWSFAALGWVALVPLLVLARAGSVVVAAVVIFAVSFVGRAVGLVSSGAEDVAVVGAAASAVGVVVVAVAHRFAHRVWPMVGTCAAAFAVVVVEYLAVRWQLPAAGLLTLSATQPGDLPLFRLVDVVTPLGISFLVAWVNAVLAAYGEMFLVEDPLSRHRRERGLFIQTLACFVVGVAAHAAGFLFGVFAVEVPGEGTHVDVVAAIAATGLVAMIALVISAAWSARA